MTKVHREMEGVGRTAGHGPYKCQECGEKLIRQRPPFSFRPTAYASILPTRRVDAAPRRARSIEPPDHFSPMSSIPANIDPLNPEPLVPSTPAGEMRAKKDFSQRQLELPKKVGITCRQCNEHDKFEKKEERRKSLDEAKNAHKKNAEIHNKGRQVHQTFHSVTA